MFSYKGRSDGILFGHLFDIATVKLVDDSRTTQESGHVGGGLRPKPPLRGASPPQTPSSPPQLLCGVRDHFPIYVYIHIHICIYIILTVREREREREIEREREGERERDGETEIDMC